MRRSGLTVAAVFVVVVSGGCAGHAPVSLQGYSGTAIVSDDGRTLIVGPYGLECGGTVSVVARESRARVDLFLQYVPGGSACVPGEGAMAMVPEQRIRLHAPLGHRKLADGQTGKATPWLSARLVLRPRLIPVGYLSGGLLPWISSSLYAGGVRPAACMQIYRVRNFRALSGADEFAIIQSAAGLQLQPSGGWKPIRVRGHPGQAAPGMITWREQGLTDLISTGAGWTTSKLIAIANSAPA